MLYFRVADQEKSNRSSLILIHGLFGSLENLAGIARLLSPFFNVYSIDLPNHGRSPHLSDCTLSSMSDMLVHWMDEHGLESACIVGHSLGGKVAMELALSHPNRVEQLVVLDIAPVAYLPRHEQILAGLLSIQPHLLNSRAQADNLLAQYVPELAVRTFLLKNLVKENDQFKWRMHLTDLHHNYSNLISANRKGIYTGSTLFVKGENSDYIKDHYKDDIAERFSNVQLKIVPDTGHWLHAEKPNLVSRIVLKALGENVYA
jgi:esterase